MRKIEFVSQKKRLLFLILVITSLTSLAQDLYPTENCLTDNTFEDRYASYSPNGERIVFESNRENDWNIFIMNKDGSEVQRVTNTLGNSRRPSWHPGGEKILFEYVLDSVAELRTIDLVNGVEKVIKTAVDGEEFLFANFAPDGGQIALSIKKSDKKSSIVILGDDGKMIDQITDNDFRNYYPRWSNNGEELLYFSRKETNNKDDEIYIRNLKSGEEVRLTNWPKHNFCPSWSANNDQIVYVTSMENTRPEIYIMRANGDRKIRITHNNDGDTLPNWHPHENKILITAFRNGHYQICELLLPEN